MNEIYERMAWSYMDKLRGMYSISEQLELSALISLIGYVNEINPKDQWDVNYLLKTDNTNEEFNRILQEIEYTYKFLEGVTSYLNSYRNTSENLMKVLLSINSISSIEGFRWNDFLETFILLNLNANGKESGEYGTHPFINKLGIKILNIEKGSFYDGTAGIGGTIIEASKEFNNKEELKLYGEELNNKNWALGKIRLFINGLEHVDFRKSDIIEKPAFIEDLNSHELMKFNNIMMNFPLGLNVKNYEYCIRNDEFNRFIYGNPSLGNGDMVFICHMLKSLTLDGRAVAITTKGTLFRGAGDGKIRENLIVSDLIEGVIALPSLMYTYTSIPVSIIIFNKNKTRDLKNKIFFINAENMYETIGRNQRILSDKNIEDILDIYRNKKNIDEVSILLDTKDLKEGILVPERYVVKKEMYIAPYGNVRIKVEEVEKNKDMKPLGKLSDFYRGINITSTASKQNGKLYKVIKLSDVQEGILNIHSIEEVLITSKARIKEYEVEEGDLIVSSRGSNIKICVIPKHEGQILLSQNFIGIRLRKDVSAEYVKEFLESPIGQYYISIRLAGTNIVTLSPKDLKEVPILMSKENQVTMVEKYKGEEERIKREIENLKNILVEKKLEMYKEMGIDNSFEILDKK